MLQVLVTRTLSVPPRNHRVVRILISGSGKVEIVAPTSLPGWDAEDLEVARAFGGLWLQARRKAVLRVPNLITEGRENNVLFSPQHPEFAMIEADAPEKVHWDVRLFDQSS